MWLRISNEAASATCILHSLALNLNFDVTSSITSTRLELAEAIHGPYELSHVLS